MRKFGGGWVFKTKEVLRSFFKTLLYMINTQQLNKRDFILYYVVAIITLKIYKSHRFNDSNRFGQHGPFHQTLGTKNITNKIIGI